MREDVRLYTERKFRRWTFGSWCPPQGSFAFRAFALDYIGTGIMIGCIACLVLGLQWGGSKYAWSSGPVVATLVVFAALIPVIIVWEWKLAGPSRILPLSYFVDRTQERFLRLAFRVYIVLTSSTAGRRLSRRFLRDVRAPDRNVLLANVFVSVSELSFRS